MRLGNGEWFRNPPSPLERTLRRPILYQEAIRLFLVRFLPLWFLCAWAFRLILGLGPGRMSGIGFFFAVLIEMFWLRWWYQRFWLPAHLRRINRIKHLASTVKSHAQLSQLYTSIEESVRLATRGLVEIGYVGLPSWGWEIVFRTLYPLLVKSPRLPYHELLIGFPNKTVEGDQMLWEIAKRHSGGRQRRPIESRDPIAPLQDDITQYIEKFGSKVEDVDLALPTLAEKPEVIASMIELYGNMPSPFSLLQNAASRREKTTKDVLKHVRIPQALFKKLLVFVQQNVQLREDRRHYEFLGDYSIRLMLKELSKRLKISEKELSDTNWKKLRHKSFWRKRSDRENFEILSLRSRMTTT